jgi:hypothetical protein
VALTTHLPSTTEVKERVEVYFYRPTGPSWPLLGQTLLYTMKAYRRIRGIVAVVNLDIRWRWLNFIPGRISLGKEPRYIPSRGLGSPRASMDDLEKRNIFGPVGIRTPDHPAHSLVSTPLTLSRLPDSTLPCLFLHKCQACMVVTSRRVCKAVAMVWMRRHCNSVQTGSFATQQGVKETQHISQGWCAKHVTCSHTTSKQTALLEYEPS